MGYGVPKEPKFEVGDVFFYHNEIIRTSRWHENHVCKVDHFLPPSQEGIPRYLVVFRNGETVEALESELNKKKWGGLISRM